MLATSDSVRSVYGLGRLAVEQGGAWYYPQGDALGSVRQWTDALAPVLATQAYSPFGEPLSELAVAPWGFTGEWHDPSGLVYLRARWYNGALGQFLQVDPVAGVLLFPVTSQSYLYGANNPMRYADPGGEVTLCIGISGFYGTGFGGEGYLALCFDSVGNVAIRGTGAAIGVAGTGGSVGLSVAFSPEAETVYDLEGLTACAGSSIGEGQGVGGEVATGVSPITGKEI